MVIRENVVYIHTYMHWLKCVSKAFFFVSEKDQSKTVCRPVFPLCEGKTEVFVLHGNTSGRRPSQCLLSLSRQSLLQFPPPDLFEHANLSLNSGPVYFSETLFLWLHKPASFSSMKGQLVITVAIKSAVHPHPTNNFLFLCLDHSFPHSIWFW